MGRCLGEQGGRDSPETVTPREPAVIAPPGTTMPAKPSRCAAARLNGDMRATLAYTSARILLFIAALGVLYLAGARRFLLVGLALVVSGIVSFVVLSRQRDAMSGALVFRLRQFRSRLDEGTRTEDD
jgi:hypothetical protein